MATKPTPRGKRKTPEKKDAILAKFNIRPEPTRFYGLQSGAGYETTGMSTDPREAESMVCLNPKVPARGVLLEVPDAQRAREILETMSDDLPWKDLAGDIRDDLTLVANWHGAELSAQERLTLQHQEMETASVKRKARMKLVEQMRRDADRLVIEPL